MGKKLIMVENTAGLEKNFNLTLRMTEIASRIYSEDFHTEEQAVDIAFKIFDRVLTRIDTDFAYQWEPIEKEIEVDENYEE